MFASKTVFVLGAGASYEVNLPVGAGLAEIISKKVNVQFSRGGQFVENGGDIPLYERLRRRFGQEVGEYQRAGWVIRDGLPFANSIDDFLDRHAKDERVVLYGKLAIVASILEAERNSYIFTSPSTRRDGGFVDKTKNTWYVRLLKLLGVGVSVEHVDKLFGNSAFIDFNYDRCLPQFLFEAIQPLYRLDEQRAREVVETAKILHPYGSLGDSLGSKPVQFGAPDGAIDLFEVAERIRLYTEQVKEHDEVIDQIRQTMEEAERIVFLGFGYHRQNLDIIMPNKGRASSILGTAHNISEEDCEVLQEWLRPMLKEMPAQLDMRTGRNRMFFDYIKLRSDLKAVQLFDEFARTLMS